MWLKILGIIILIAIIGFLLYEAVIQKEEEVKIYLSLLVLLGIAVFIYIILSIGIKYNEDIKKQADINTKNAIDYINNDHPLYQNQ